MSNFWIGVLTVGALWLFFSFRRNIRAASAFSAADEAAPWLESQGIAPASAKFSAYDDPHLVRNAGSTVLVGLARVEGGDTIGFAIEVMPGRGVVASEILVPYGIATWHRSASLESRSTGRPLLDVLKAKATARRLEADDDPSPEQASSRSGQSAPVVNKQPNQSARTKKPSGNTSPWREYDRPPASRRGK